MGARYLTADQCHGHRVPMYTRESVHDRFRPIEACPPSGCLTCSDQFPKGVPCRNDTLAAAPALTPAMLKEPALRPRSATGLPTLPVLG